MNKLKEKCKKGKEALRREGDEVLKTVELSLIKVPESTRLVIRFVFMKKQKYLFPVFISYSHPPTMDDYAEIILVIAIFLIISRLKHFLRGGPIIFLLW